MNDETESQNQQPAVQPIIVKTTNRFSLFLQVFTAIVLLTSSWVTYRNFKIQHNWSQQIRRNQIAPNLVLSPGTRYTNGRTLTINIKNIGNGPAQDVFLLISMGDHFLSHVVNTFTPDSGSEKQKYILPSQDVSCVVDLWNLIPGLDTIPKRQLDEMLFERALYFYFSYFDSDNNEYLLIQNAAPNSINGLMIANFSETPLDSLLLFRAKGIVGSRRVYQDPKIRSDLRWVRRELVYPPVTDSAPPRVDTSTALQLP
jgi:hypothetical protein